MKKLSSLRFRLLASYALVGIAACLLTAVLLGTAPFLRRDVILAALVLSFFLALLSAWLVLRLFFGSLDEITRVARSFAAGDLSSRITARSSGETTGVSGGR